MAIKIYIDQGHNPVNPNAGAEGNGYREQDLVYNIGVLLSEILENYGFEARLSRVNDQVILGTSNTTSLAARVNDANAWGADYFISLHTNASVNPMASGSEAYVYSLNSSAYPLAESILEQLNLSTGLRNRGVQPRPGLYVLRKTQMPAVLVELGFITSPVDSSLMANYPNRFAQGVADGIVDYINRAETVSFPENEGDTVAANSAVGGDNGHGGISDGANDTLGMTNDIGGTGDKQNYGSQNGASGNGVSESYEVTEDGTESRDPSDGYERFLIENPKRGYLKIQAFAGRQSYPIEGVRVVITRDFGDEQVLFFEGVTDIEGMIDGIELPAPPRENSLVFPTPDKAAVYDMTAVYEGVLPQRSQVEIYEGIKSIQPILIGAEVEK